MGHRARHTESSIRVLLEQSGDVGEAAAAVVHGSGHEAHWQTLEAFAARDGIDSVAQALARTSDFKGPSREWWRCTLLLRTELSAEQALHVTRELCAIEEAGSGPAFDGERHALQVGDAVRWLEAHGKSVMAGAAGRVECSAVASVMLAVRVARAGGGRQGDRIKTRMISIA